MKNPEYDVIDQEVQKSQQWNVKLYRPNNEWAPIARFLWTYKFVLLNTALSSIVATDLSWYGEKMIPWYIIGATLYIAGSIADKMSTVHVFGTMHTADNLGIDHNLIETNPNLPARPSTSELFGLKRISIEAAAILPVVILPPVGVINSIGRVIAAIHNHKLDKNLQKEIDIIVKNK